MIRAIFRVLFKVLLALGVVAAVAAVIQYLDEQKPDYIEIYNDDGFDGESY